MKKILNRSNRIADGAGHKVLSTIDPATKNADDVSYEYKAQTGDFDYEKYKAIQVRRNEIKPDEIRALEDNIKFVSESIKAHSGNVEIGLCYET